MPQPTDPSAAVVPPSTAAPEPSAAPEPTVAPVPATPLLQTSPWFAQLIDDTGMFPPANLTLANAYTAHLDRRSGRHAWMLGPLMVPSSRNKELAELAGSGLGHIGVLLDGPASAINAGKTWADGLHLDCQSLATTLPVASLVQVEVTVPNDANWDTIEIALEPLCSAGLRVFFEISPGPGLTDRLTRVAALNKRLERRGATIGAKLRMVGVAAHNVPHSSAVAGFLVACAVLELRVKATAGLHQPFRGNSATSGFIEHGFINVLTAAARAQAGRKLNDVTAVLDITTPDRFSFVDGNVMLDGIPVGDAAPARRLLWSIGSATFDNSVGALSERGWID